MQISTLEQEEQLIEKALASARDTRVLIVEPGSRHDAQPVFQMQFGSAQPIVIADQNTFRVAGADVAASLKRRAGCSAEPFVFDSDVYAEYERVEELARALAGVDAIPVAVGSGTLNDLTKLAAHLLKRPYMVVATAASMDGYTAYGASITRDGSKQTFDCPAPRAVIAGLEVIAGAPAGMNAAGYADLMAKCAAGGDWILAEAAGEEAIDPSAWESVQGPLRGWLASPQGVANGDPASLRHLVYGLMMSGFVMQAVRSSRPASGADHQFSHLWDMQHHTHRGVAPSHGFKVGIGTLASLALFDELLARDMGSVDVEYAVSRWPSLAALEARITAVFGNGELGAKALEETRAKYIPHEHLRSQLLRLRERWPALRERLQDHLPRFQEVREMLRLAGCAFEPEHIGISRERLRASYEQAWYIRRRYTVLDFVHRVGLAESALDNIFSGSGPWASVSDAA